VITLKAAAMAAQGFSARRLSRIDGLQLGLRFRGISGSGLYLFQIAVNPPSTTGRPRLGGSPGVVVDAESGNCRCASHREYADILGEIADGSHQPYGMRGPVLVVDDIHTFTAPEKGQG
jgi:hypothetical protein